jgi:hypothetical protein
MLCKWKGADTIKKLRKSKPRMRWHEEVRTATGRAIID